MKKIDNVPVKQFAKVNVSRMARNILTSNSVIIGHSHLSKMKPIIHVDPAMPREERTCIIRRKGDVHDLCVDFNISLEKPTYIVDRYGIKRDPVTLMEIDSDGVGAKINRMKDTLS